MINRNVIRTIETIEARVLSVLAALLSEALTRLTQRRVPFCLHCGKRGCTSTQHLAARAEHARMRALRKQRPAPREVTPYHVERAIEAMRVEVAQVRERDLLAAWAKILDMTTTELCDQVSDE